MQKSFGEGGTAHRFFVQSYASGTPLGIEVSQEFCPFVLKVSISNHWYYIREMKLFPTAGNVNMILCEICLVFVS